MSRAESTAPLAVLPSQQRALAAAMAVRQAGCRLGDITSSPKRADAPAFGALLFCLKRPGRGLKEKVETWLAWERVATDVRSGTLGEDYDRSEVAEVQGKVREALEDARDEVWATYTIVVVADTREPDGLKVIDLGAGHASSGETLSARILMALRTDGLLSESVGAAYIDRHWPPALQESGAWPLASLRQAFLDGSLTRLLDPEAVLRAKILEFVAKGDLGFASGLRPDGNYQRVWYAEPVSPDEIVFDHDVFILRKERAKALMGAPASAGTAVPLPVASQGVGPEVAGPPVLSALPETVRRIAGPHLGSSSSGGVEPLGDQANPEAERS